VENQQEVIDFTKSLQKESSRELTSELGEADLQNIFDLENSVEKEQDTLNQSPSKNEKFTSGATSGSPYAVSSAAQSLMVLAKSTVFSQVNDPTAPEEDEIFLKKLKK